tara:strand:- start:14211 stop:18296 length:4086 start_codon:yes stop_codon:yes gene_type:complete
MIDRIALLSDLQSLLKRLEADLLDRSDSDDVPEVREWLLREYQQAKESERTAQTQKQWVDDFITQVAAAWVLSAVFARFLEDNGLVDPPRISGPQDVDNPASSRLSRARDERELYFGQHPKHTDRDYLLDVFAGLAKLPATADVFGEHNPLNSLPNWLGPDAAGELLTFFQKIDAGTGQLVHDFTDPDWNTRFLGDLYQDLSEAARKKYALLQTPEFVEEFILDRTLEPALDEFGLTEFKMIDPACGSGHFLLGSFPRILDHWNQEEPGTNVRVLVQRTLDSIHGVDINPFAIAIARFRLLLAALAACGVKRLADAPAFAMNLACGDSLYHGVERQQTLGDWTDESHYFRTEDAENLRRILQEGTFHAVVANPPYIVVSDPAANAAYRRLYKEVCHKQYSLAAPFLQRINKLGIDSHTSAAFTGQITANSFMNNEFGTKLVETYLPTIDLTHIVDTRYLQPEGHETPTVILFGRARRPVNADVRVVRGIKGESPVPPDLSAGQVWTSILRQIDLPGSEGEFVSVCDTSREELSTHPWSIGGGGASELYDYLVSTANTKLRVHLSEIGRTTHTGENPAFYLLNGADRTRGWSDWVLPVVSGEDIRDWLIEPEEVTIFPYDHQTGERRDNMPITLSRHYWIHRATLRSRQDFGETIEERGLHWTDHSMFFPKRHRHTTSVAFAFKATHNHFALNDSRFVFNQTAPVIQLREGTRKDYCELREILNSSVSSLWEREVHREVSGKREERWQGRLERNSTKLKDFPLPEERPSIQSSAIELNVANLSGSLPYTVVQKWVDSGRDELAVLLEAAKHSANEAIALLIRLQEDLDWECYRLYGLCEDDLTYQSCQSSVVSGQEDSENRELTTDNSFGIQLGERAFEIVLARKMTRGEVATTWFERHGSTPITELPDQWPDDYRQLVERRIAVIESNPQIALIEQPEYKRRWNTESWDSQVERALKFRLLNRLESYFDFDGRMRGEESSETATAPLAEIAVVSLSRLADVAARDEQFMEVGEVYRDDPAFHVQRLVEELVAAEHVPLLPVLRYNPTGLRKREQWEDTWELQREEDELERQRTALRHALKLREKELEQQHSEELAAIAVARKPLLTACLSLSEVLPEPPEIDESQDAEGMAAQLLALKIAGKHKAAATAVHDGQEAVLKAKRTLRRAVLKAAAADTKYQDLATELEAVPENPEIPVPPKYAAKDFISTGGARYWSLRGKLDVPKERWISFPHSHAEDGSLTICWAGYDHLQQATAISAWYVDIRDRQGGKEDSRLIPLLACLIELLPWLKQWHNDIDPTYDMAMGDYFAGFVQEEARSLNMTQDEIKAWQPPKKAKKKATRKKATRKKATKKKAASEETAE